MAEKLGPTGLRPVATTQRLQLAVPDTRPQAARLAASLDEFAANVTGITVRKTREHAKGQEEKGRTAAAEAIAAGQDTIDEMVQAGIIDRGSNPFFRDGVLFMAGKARADAYNNALTIAAAEQIPADSTDPDAMDDLIESVAGEFLTAEDDEATQAGFAERAEGYAVLAKQRHAQLVANNLEDLNLSQAADLFRGVALLATDGVDKEFIISNLVPAIQVQAEEYLANLSDPSRHDKKVMNRAITAALGSLVEDGTLGEDDVISAMKLLKGGTGSLWGIQEHAAVIQEAIDTQVNRETTRHALKEKRELRVKQASEQDATEAMFIAAGESGVLDISEIERIQRESGGTKFRLGYMQQMRELSLQYEQAAQDTYIGDIELRREYGSRILSGEIVSLQELSTRIKRGELTLDQAIELGNLVVSHRNMLQNDPVKAAMFRRTDQIIKGALTSWAGSEFGSQSYSAALPAMASALQAWQSDPKNANLTAESPEFLTFVDELKDNLQRLYMDPAQWQDMQETQKQNEAINKLEVWSTALFESNRMTLTKWYAETLLLESGRPLSPSLSDFLSAPGRQLDAETLDQGVFSEAIATQLLQAGIKLDDEGFIEVVTQLMVEMGQARTGIDLNPGAKAAPKEDSTSSDSEVRSLFAPEKEGDPIPSIADVVAKLLEQTLQNIPDTEDPSKGGKIPSIQQLVRDAFQQGQAALAKGD